MIFFPRARGPRNVHRKKVTELGYSNSSWLTEPVRVDSTPPYNCDHTARLNPLHCLPLHQITSFSTIIAAGKIIGKSLAMGKVSRDFSRRLSIFFSENTENWNFEVWKKNLIGI